MASNSVDQAGSPLFQGSSYGPLVWAPNLDPDNPNIYKIGARKTDPTRIEGAHNKGL